MKRRAFVKSGLVFTGLIWIPKPVLAQRFPPAALVSSKAPAAGGGGGCGTQKDAQDTLDGFDASFLRYIASKLRAGSSYNLCKVAVNIARNALEDADFLVTMRADDSGSPNAAVLGTSDTVANATVTDDFTWVSFTFGTPVSLTSGSDYWIVITRTDAADGLQVYWQLDQEAGAAEGLKDAANATPTTWNTISGSASGAYRTFSS